MIRRKTVQKDLVLSAVRTLCCHPTADEVFSHVIKTAPSVSRGTVYRNLGVLAEEGKILRVLVANGKDRFDHNTDIHGHAICGCCGKVYDVAPVPRMDFGDFIPAGFVLSGIEFIINGKCKECASANNN